MMSQWSRGIVFEDCDITCHITCNVNITCHTADRFAMSEQCFNDVTVKFGGIMLFCYVTIQHCDGIIQHCSAIIACQYICNVAMCCLNGAL